ncbi:predicted protein [Lichtheimia corymbifera JMRC:FSU:9682]|uniref:Ankyrin repeat protein n=1 Tax=Lichtheimia corymbifera JMRC:FSU:9682 TaxID=1263082 RepID=A0A068SDL6_9FUNG|nr:predicted protein [Lichtheimia corymbifera JMRC:FSU:9682]
MTSSSFARHRYLQPKEHGNTITSNKNKNQTSMSSALKNAIINGSRQDFNNICERASSHDLAQALLTWRVARVIQYPLNVRQEAVRKLGPLKKSSEFDAIQYTLLLQKGALAIAMLEFLQQHCPQESLRAFVNRQWGSSNTALHLACFWNMPRLVRLLLDLGADCNARNANLVSPADCCRTAPHGNDCRAMLSSEKQHQQQQQQAIRPSMLLKKAMEQQHFNSNTSTTSSIMDSYMPTTPPPPSLPAAIPPEYFAAGVPSTTSTSSSMLSADDSSTCWTPPPSPMRRRMCFSPPVNMLHETHSNNSTSKHVRFDPQTLIHDACMRGNLPELLSLLKDMDTKSLPTYGAQDRSLLQVAIIFGHHQLIPHLLEKSKDQVDHYDTQGWTALHYAAKYGRWVAMEQLAPLANIHARTLDGLTIYDCPKTHVDKQKCRAIVERALRRHHHGNNITKPYHSY